MTDTSDSDQHDAAAPDGGDRSDAGSSPEPSDVVRRSAAADATRRWRLGLIVAVVAVAALLVSQLMIVQTLRSTNDQLDALDARLVEQSTALGSVGNSVTGLQEEVAGVGDRMTDLEEQRLALAPGANSEAPGTDVAEAPEPSEGITVVAASLPWFQGDSNNDPALGMVLGTVAGPEYYSAQPATLSPDDGISRAIFVWAHWCPYCQQEMPEVAAWVNANATDYQHLEIVSVTTAIDENAANPLYPYLDDNQWPFPVLVDDNGAMAAQLGVNAFPFWVFVGPDGTVLGRTAGALPIEQLDGIFQQLETIGAQA